MVQNFITDHWLSFNPPVMLLLLSSFFSYAVYSDHGGTFNLNSRNLKKVGPLLQTKADFSFLATDHDY